MESGLKSGRMGAVEIESLLDADGLGVDDVWKMDFMRFYYTDSAPSARIIGPFTISVR